MPPPRIILEKQTPVLNSDSSNGQEMPTKLTNSDEDTLSNITTSNTISNNSDILPKHAAAAPYMPV